jgi:hypothetical protein
VPLDGAAGIDGVVEADDEAGALAADVAAAVELAVGVELDELEHAAASNATGTKAVVVKINRIFLATGEYSFMFGRTPKHAVANSHARAREQKTAARSGACG